MAIILTGCSHNRIDTADSTRQLILTCEALSKQIALKAIEEYNSGVCTAHVEIGKEYMLLCQRQAAIKERLK